MGAIKDHLHDTADELTLRIYEGDDADEFYAVWDRVLELVLDGVSPIDITNTIAGETA